MRLKHWCSTQRMQEIPSLRGHGCSSVLVFQHFFVSLTHRVIKFCFLFSSPHQCDLVVFWRHPHIHGVRFSLLSPCGNLRQDIYSSRSMQHLQFSYISYQLLRQQICGRLLCTALLWFTVKARLSLSLKLRTQLSLFLCFLFPSGVRLVFIGWASRV